MKRTTTLLFFLVPIITFSQTIFKGTVADEFGPLDGANIMIKNSRVGVVANADGFFEIQAKKEDTLLVSYLGYNTKEVVIDNEEQIYIELEGNIALNEVEIVAYGVGRRCCYLRCGVYSVTCKDYESDVITEKLYPNPSKNGIFQLNLLNNYKKVKVHVSNISGKLIKIEERQMALKNIEIDLSNYPAGIYIINIIADGKRLSPKKAIRG